MRIFRYLLVTLVILMVAIVTAQNTQPFRLVFANTSLSSVLRAVGIRTGANIVYVGKEDPSVTLDVTAGNADEALRFVTTAASMTYRRVGQTYIVAKPEDMRQALEPFGLRYRMTLTNVTSADAASLLRGSLPYLTVQPVGTDQLVLTGTSEDIQAAKDILANATATSTEIVPVHNVSSTKIVDVLSDMFPDVRFRAVAQGDTGGNLIITGKADRIAEAKSTIGLLDAENIASGTQESFSVYDVKYSSAPTLIALLKNTMPDVVAVPGPDTYAPGAPTFNPISGMISNLSNGNGGTNVGGSSSGSSGSNGSQPDTLSNLPTGQSGQGGSAGVGTSSQNKRLLGETAKQLVLRGAKARVDQAMQMLASVDLKPKQVTVEVKVVDYTPTVDSNTGFNWTWTPFTFQENGGETRPAGFGSFTRVPWSFQSVLNALITHKEAKILATPSVQVLDNENANIFIGDTVRARITTTGALGAQQVQIAEFPIGIILLLRPRVNSDGDVTLHVHPVVSTITSVDSDNVPQTSTREAETTLLVKNGETIVLGGLIRDEMTKTISEVPLLSKLPLIGELFRNTNVNGRKSEILIFITPKIGDGTPASSVKTPGQ